MHKKEDADVDVESAREKLRRAYEELEKTVEQRLADIGVMAASMANEMRSPLAAIQIAVYNIKRKNKDQSLDRHLATIEKKVLESDRVIGGLLAFSRIKMPCQEQFEFYGALSRCIETMAHKYRSGKVAVEEHFRCDKGMRIEADPAQIAMLLSNIMDNAYQAMPDARGVIVVTVCQKDRHSISIAVRDNGVGIGGEDIEKIFEPFFTTRARGSGLGLAVCKQIADLHHGTIKVDSTRGVGTTVTVTLPVKMSAAGCPGRKQHSASLYHS